MSVSDPHDIITSISKKQGESIQMPISKAEDGLDLTLNIPQGPPHDQLVKELGYNLKGHQLIVHFATLDGYQRTLEMIKTKSYFNKIRYAVLIFSDNSCISWFIGAWTFQERAEAAFICSNNQGKVIIVSLGAPLSDSQ